MRIVDPSLNPTRRLILNYILENPGISFSHIMSFFGISKGTLRYHLDQLERAGMIRREKISGRAHFHGVGDAIEPDKVQNMSIQQVRVFRTIQTSQGISHGKLLEMTSLSKDALRYHLRRLVSKGLVEVVKEDDDVKYRPISQEEVRKRIYLELVRRLLDGEIDEETFQVFKSKL